MYACASAPVPPPPTKVTVGAEVYPPPGLSMTMPVMMPGNTACAVAAGLQGTGANGVPQPPTRVTVAPLVYPEPALVRVTPVTWPGELAFGAAVIDGILPAAGFDMLTVGAIVYPAPPEVSVTDASV